MDDAERPGIGVINSDLLVGQPVFEQLVFDALIGKRAGRIEAKGLQIAGEHFHRCDAAGLDRLDKLRSRRERKVLAAPEAEPLGIGEIVDRRGAGRRDIDDAGVRQRVLKPESARPCWEAAWSPRSPLPPPAFCMAWLSSKMITPWKSEPNHSTIWRTRETFSSRASERSVA